MKLLSNADMVRIVEGASDADILAAERGLPRASTQLSPDWLSYGVKEGFYRVCQLEFEGARIATVFYSLNDCRTLVINASFNHTQAEISGSVWEACFRRLAGSLNALRVQFETKRGGVIRRALRQGYEICGVILRREIGAVAAAQEFDRPLRDQVQQQNLSGPSESKQDSTTSESVSNQQVAADDGGIGLGAGASGNTISVTTDDVNAIDANTQVTGEALAAGNNDTNAALASNIAALQSASALAQTGLAAATTVAGASIASNTDIAGASIAAGDEESTATLEAAQNLGGEAIASGDQIGAEGLETGATVAGEGIAAGIGLANGVEATSTDDLEASLEGVETLTAGSQATESNVVQSALSAVLAGQASTSDLIQSVVNSNTSALEQSNQNAQDLAAGALSQEGTIANNAVTGGTQTITPFNIGGIATGKVLVGVAVLAALVGVVYLFKE